MDAVVIGAGHAGLAASQQLAMRGVDHIVLERGRIGESWLGPRWDSFALNTPAWMNLMPGDTDADLAQPRDGFPSHTEWVEHLIDYADRWTLPIRQGVAVTQVDRLPTDGYRIHTAGALDEPIDCRVVVAASGVQAAMAVRVAERVRP